MADEQEVSPTGLPRLPPKVVPYLMIGGAVASAVQLVEFSPLVTKLATVATLAVSLLGLASPGLRRGQ